MLLQINEENQGTAGSATSETGWELTMLLQLEKHIIAIGGVHGLQSPW